MSESTAVIWTAARPDLLHDAARRRQGRRLGLRKSTRRSAWRPITETLPYIYFIFRTFIRDQTYLCYMIMKDGLHCWVHHRVLYGANAVNPLNNNNNDRLLVQNSKNIRPLGADKLSESIRSKHNSYVSFIRYSGVTRQKRPARPPA